MEVTEHSPGAQSESPSSRTKWLRPCQVIVTAMGVGALVLIVVFAFLRWRNGPPPAMMNRDAPRVLATVAGFAVIVAFVVPPLHGRDLRRTIRADIHDPARLERERDDIRDALRTRHRTSLIMVWSLCEFAALISVLGFWRYGEWANLAIGGVAIAILLRHFPTHHGIERWIDQQCDKLATEIAS
jgi:hypothetical protein